VGFIRAAGRFSATGHHQQVHPFEPAMTHDGRERSRSRLYWYWERNAMMQNTGKKFEIIWADKAALIAILFFLSLLALCWSLAFLAIGGLGTKHLWNYMGAQGVALAILIPVLILVFARTVDFLSDSPTPISQSPR
jgi:hypothetical protein